jgi:hypothetical protein
MGEADRIGELYDKLLLDDMDGRLSGHGEYGLMVARENRVARAIWVAMTKRAAERSAGDERRCAADRPGGRMPPAEQSVMPLKKWSAHRKASRVVGNTGNGAQIEDVLA